MLTEVLGIRVVRTLYLQLLYGCNFRCHHCFHGERLEWPDRLSREEARALMHSFARDYRTGSVVLLGGEPFLHPRFVDIARDANELGLEVSVCTNGYKIGRRLRQASRYLSVLRVSFEGLESTHDQIRRQGSFVEAVRTVETARSLGLTVGATITVTRASVDELDELADLLVAAGVTQLKFHQLRPIGNAAKHPELIVLEDQRAKVEQAFDRIRRAHRVTVEVDQDLVDSSNEMVGVPVEIDRVEVQPTGEAYMSCKAVGSGANAFRVDRNSGGLVYSPTSQDEIATEIEDVIYR